MEDESKTKGVFSDVKPILPLFPSSAQLPREVNNKCTLFPSAQCSAQESISTIIPNKGLDWLENKSFTSDTAKKFLELQDEVKRLQSNTSDNDDVVVIKEETRSGSQDNLRVTGNPESRNKVLVQLSSDSESTNSENEGKKEKKDKLKKTKHSDKYSSEQSYERSHHSKKKKKKDKARGERLQENFRGDNSWTDESDLEGDNSKKKKKEKRRHTSSDEFDDREHQKRKKKHKHKQKKHKKEKYEHVADPKHDLPELYPSNKIFIEETDLPPERAFRLDHTADKNSWTYGSLYKLHIAKYKQFCYNCLGARGRQQILLGSKDKRKKGKSGSDRYFGKENRIWMRKAAVEVIVTKGNGQENLNEFSFSNEESYIEVSSADGQTCKEGSDVRERILDAGTSMYVQGKALGIPDKNESEETPYNDYNPTRHKVAEYNRKLRETPNDIQLWLDFVKFQDSQSIEEENFGKESASKQDFVRHNSRAVLDKKLSIIDKALESNPANIDLLLTKLELSSDIWDAAKTSKELEQLLFIHPANTKLWRYYLTFNQSRLTLFTVSKMTKQYHKCFKTLFGIMEGRVQTHSVPQNLSTDVTELFLQYCYFLKHAGHKEKAVASLQAVLEYNLFCPTSLEGVTRDTKMAAFEDFWDSGCARLGEHGADGWRTWNEKKDSGKEHDQSSQTEDNLEDIEESVIEQKKSKCNTWLEIETLRDCHHWLPWKPNIAKEETEEDCEDVERLVLFDDISRVLFTIPSNLHFKLVTTFMSLLGMGPSINEFSSKTFNSELFLEETKVVSNSMLCREKILCSEGSENLQEFAINTLMQLIPHFKGKVKSDLTLMLIKAQLKKFNKSDSELTKNDKKEMRKIVKNVLKEEHNRNDLLVWAEYINLERVIGKPGEAEAIAETALSMNSGKVVVATLSDQVVGLMSLYSLYVEILLKMNQKSSDSLFERMTPVSVETKKKVLSVLSCLVEGRVFKPKKIEELSGSAVLKTSSKFAKLIESACEELGRSSSTHNDNYLPTKLCCICWCYSLFAYCRTDLQAGLKVYTQAASVIRNTENATYFRELDQQLYVDQLRLILYHMSTSSVPLLILRQCLDSALEGYPDNGIFLALFVDVERKSRISGRLNRFFDKWCRSTMSPVPMVFAVCAQLEFLTTITDQGATEDSGVNGSGLIHRTRAWLEQSLSQSTLQHCPLLWRLYLKLEKQIGNSTRLKGVYYRAVQQCPWVKSMYMDGVRLFGADQLQETVDLMTEKELRVQLPVEELDILIG